MSNPFFEHPILNSPYEYPTRHWELDSSGQPTQEVLEHRRRADFITPIPKPKKRKGQDGVQPHELGVFVRSEAQLDRARAATAQAGLSHKVIDDQVDTSHGHASICTMHLAKGLEFRAVVVMACDDEVIPLAERIESAGDDTELEEIYTTERHLLYVACTRARDFLLVTSGGSVSEFLDDLNLETTSSR